MKLPIIVLAVFVSPISFTLGEDVRSGPVDDVYDHGSTSRLFGQTIGKGYIQSDTLIDLSIEYSEVVYCERGAFEGAANLKNLNLQGNNIVPKNLFSFGPIPKLVRLQLNDQRNSASDRIIVNDQYLALRSLNVANTAANGIDIKASNPFPELRLLNFSTNNIVNFDIENALTDKLTYLYLNGNQLGKISLRKFVNLISLELNGNKIQILGDKAGLDLTGLNNLNSLSVANNEINSISKGAFRETMKLESLNVAGNRLSSFHNETLESLNNLTELILDSNFFDVVPITTTMPNLTMLSMNCNDLKFLKGDHFSNLSSLVTLFLGGNKIERFDSNAFQQLTTLRELRLNDNRLSYLPYYWDIGMKNLQRLDLSRNRITSLESVFFHSEFSLKHVYMDGNPLEVIRKSVFDKFVQDTSIYLISNRTALSCKP